jgi:membrane protease YdiL (CAAX protease family)
MALLVDLPGTWKQKTLQGLLYGTIFILVNLFLPRVTSIGFPMFFSFGTELVAVVLFAGIMEELIFRLGLVDFLYALKFPKWMIVLASGISFTLFHYAAYGQSLAAQSASFIGAFIFGVVACVIAIRERSFIIPAVMHGVFNLWLVIRLHLSM